MMDGPSTTTTTATSTTKTTTPTVNKGANSIRLPREAEDTHDSPERASGTRSNQGQELSGNDNDNDNESGGSSSRDDSGSEQDNNSDPLPHQLQHNEEDVISYAAAIAGVSTAHTALSPPRTDDDDDDDDDDNMLTAGGSGGGFGGDTASLIAAATRAAAASGSSPSNTRQGGGGGGGNSGGADGFSRRVTMGSGASGSNMATTGGGGGYNMGGGAGGGVNPSAFINMNIDAAAASASSGNNNRRNSFSSLSLMDDLFNKRSSMGLGTFTASGTMTGMIDTAAIGASGMSGGGGDSYMFGGSGGGSNGGFGRRGSMDSTTAALDAAIFDLTRRRYSMANSSFLGGGGNSVVGSATINSLAAGGGSGSGGPIAASFMDPPGGGQNPYSAGVSGGNYDGGDDGQRGTSMGMGGGNSVAGMDYGGDVSGIMWPVGMMPQNVMSGMAQQQGRGGAMMNPAFQQQRMQNMTHSIAARQQQLQAQQKELERRQRELEQQRRDLISSMQQRKLYIQRQQQEQQMQQGGFAGGAGGFEGLMPPGSSGSFDNPMSGAGGYGGGGMGGYTGTGRAGIVGGGAGGSHKPSTATNPSMMGTSSDHGSRMGGGATHNSDANSSGGGSQQWWICQVCNTKAFASHDEALAHESICAQRQAQQQSRGFGGYNPMGAPGMMAQSQGVSQAMHASNPRGRPKNDRPMDASVRTAGTSHSYEPVFSKGPFATMEKPLPLSMPTDKDWLTPLHCFVRKHCVEVFCATEADVAAPSKGKRKPIQVGQIGIRCPHCHPGAPAMQMLPQQNKGAAGSHDGSGGSKKDLAAKARERGSVYYPTTIASIYNATMNLLQRHLHSCSAVPREVMSRYETLKSDDARSGTSKKYWIESALAIGLVDTEMGIRFSAETPPPLPQLTDSQKDMQKHILDQTRTSTDDGDDDHDDETPSGSKLDRSDTDLAEPAPLTAPEDKAYSTAFSYQLLSQMKPCVFTEADRLGKRKGLPPGFPGLACRHCFGGYGSGRFFPSSIKTLSDTSKTLNVLHNHMIRCRKCPTQVREMLERLRHTHDEERSKMKFGSQKAFFARIWGRLHGTDQASSMDQKKQTIKSSPKRKATASPFKNKPDMDPEDDEHDDDQQQQHWEHPDNTEGSHKRLRLENNDNEGNGLG